MSLRHSSSPAGDDPTLRVPTGSPQGTGATKGENERLGPYRLVHVLGQGGMGVVHLGIDPRGRAVAIKVLRDHVAHDLDSRARLAREVSSLSRVQHPNVAPVLDADTTGPRPYVVTRFVPGTGLDDVVRDDGPFRGERLVRLGRGLAAAIEAIHAAGIVHRDLKPGNVLMVDDDPVVIDFGIAHVADDVRLTSTGLVMGTPGYLSPEVVSGRPVTAATDWWGWAATVAFAATGRPPFGRGPMHVVLDRVRDGQADLEGLEPGLRALLERAFTRDAAQRPTADELLAGLAAYGATVRGPSDPTVATPTGPETAAMPQAGRHDPPEPTPRAWQPPPPAGSWTPSAPERAGAHAPAASSGASPRPGQDGGAVAAGAPVPHAYGPDAGMGDPRLGRPGRSGALTALALTIAGLAATWPIVALAVAGVWAIVARASDRVVTATVLRRHSYGSVRRSDGVVAALTSPLHLLAALLSSLLSGLLVALVGASVAFLVSAVGSAVLGLDLSMWGAPALAAGALAGVWTAWWGPGGTSLRRGSRSVMRAFTPEGLGADVVTSGLAVVAVALLVWSVIAHGVPAWVPYGPPSGPSPVPWQW